MSKQEWSELALVGGAAIYYGMSYGNYVAAGMPDLERFKRAVEKGEFDPKISKRDRKGTLLALAAKDRGAAKAKRKEPLKVERVNLICKRCGRKFDAVSNLGPVPVFCPECRVIRQEEQRKVNQKAYRERKKVGELLA